MELNYYIIEAKPHYKVHSLLDNLIIYNKI